MPVVIIGLITIACLIWAIPTKEEKQEEINAFRELFPCKPHTWVDKPSGFDDGSSYTVCEKCKFLPGGGYEV